MKIKKVVNVIGTGALIVNLLFVTRMFIMAYMNPNKIYLMNMNNYGEATFEIILVLFLLPFGLYVIIDKVKNIYKNWEVG